MKLHCVTCSQNDVSLSYTVQVVGTSLPFLPPLASLVSLRILDVARNCLSSLPCLPHSLLLLCVERNSLLLLPSLSHLTSLRHLLASHNQICDLGYYRLSSYCL